MASIDDVISSNSETISYATQQAANLANRISNWVPNVSVGRVRFSHDPQKPSMAPPKALSDWLPEDGRTGDLHVLDERARQWLDEYFPELSGCLREHSPEQWVCKILSGDDPFADSEAVFANVWNQARDQAYRERNSLSAQVRAEFSSRGFVTPPGAMLGALLRVEEAASDAIGSVNREEARRLTELKLELLRFAQDSAVKLKAGIMQLMADFYRQWLNMPERGIELARAKAQVYSSFQAAMSDYYRVELGFEELRLKAKQTAADVEVSNDRNRASLNFDNAAAPALANAARAFGDVAAAAAASNGALLADLSAGG